VIPLVIYRISVQQDLRPAPLKGARLRALVREAAARLSTEGSDRRILVVDDAGMERWNRRFLGRPRTTNVIAFPEYDRGSALAGDILVSAPTCLRETSEWPGSPEERVFFFVIHGMLHLLGYDHEKRPADAGRMRAKERKVYRDVLRGRTP
jgi:rRNA maturation RNase YbeY